jgi:hypothetical protein
VPISSATHTSVGLPIGNNVITACRTESIIAGCANLTVRFSILASIVYQLSSYRIHTAIDLSGQDLFITELLGDDLPTDARPAIQASESLTTVFKMAGACGQVPFGTKC